ncbi:MAG: substrate-binding domain-containing protein [Flavobacteriales bacterium]
MSSKLKVDGRSLLERILKSARINNVFKSVQQNSIVGLLFVLVLFTACDDPPRDPNVDDSPTFGRAVILADEGFEKLLEDQLLVFNSTYQDAEVVVHYMPEAQLVKAMMADSVRAVFGSFIPGGDQEAYFRTRSLAVQKEAIATDGIAVIVSPNSTIQKISNAQLGALLSGEVVPGIPATNTLIFDRNGSSVPRTLVDSLLAGDVQRMKRGSAVDGVAELVERVANDTNAIGFISFAEISDEDDPACNALRAQIRMLPVSRTDTSTAYPPDQGTLKDGSYPLRRKVIMLVTEGKSGLGTGFASFVAGHKGQRIILKQGLAPERTPSRDIEIVQP